MFFMTNTRILLSDINGNRGGVNRKCVSGTIQVMGLLLVPKLYLYRLPFTYGGIQIKP